MKVVSIVALIILLSLLLLAVYMLVTIPWIVHKSMTKGDAKQYGYAGYDEFVKQFNRVDWETDFLFPNSLFGKDFNIDKYHASIFKFNGNGMIMKSPLAYFKATRYAKKYIRENRELVEW